MSLSKNFQQRLGDELGRFAVEQKSGILRCERGKLRRLICIDHGRIALLASNVVEEQIGETLVARGLIGTLEQESILAHGGGGDPESLLVESGLIDAETLAAAAEARVRGLIYATLDWNDGGLKISVGRPDLASKSTVDIDPFELLLSYTRGAAGSLDRVRTRLGPSDGRPVAVERFQCFTERVVEISTLTEYLFAHCDGTREFSAIVGASPAPAEQTWREIYGLLLCGALQLSRHAKLTDAALSAAVSRKEVLTRLEKAVGANYYMVLELGSTATADQVRQAYYFLARRFHPDRFRSGPLYDLLPRIERYFAMVTEAYNTLENVSLRASYDEHQQLSGASAGPADQDTAYLAKQNHIRARTLIERGRFNDAVTALKNAIKLDEGEARYPLELGQLLAKNPRHRAEAEAALIRANQLDPSLSDGYLTLGHLYRKAERHDEAARMFREVLRWEPGHLEANEQLKEMGQPTEAAGERGVLRGLFGG